MGKRYMISIMEVDEEEPVMRHWMAGAESMSEALMMASVQAHKEGL